MCVAEAAPPRRGAPPFLQRWCCWGVVSSWPRPLAVLQGGWGAEARERSGWDGHCVPVAPPSCRSRRRRGGAPSAVGEPPADSGGSARAALPRTAGGVSGEHSCCGVWCGWWGGDGGRSDGGGSDGRGGGGCGKEPAGLRLYVHLRRPLAAPVDAQRPAPCPPSQHLSRPADSVLYPARPSTRRSKHPCVAGVPCT